MPRNWGDPSVRPAEAPLGLSGTLDTFTIAEVLGLVEHARQTGALEVRGPDGHGTLYTTDGRFCAGEAADYSGPVESREALDVRLVDVCFHLFRIASGDYEFTANRLPPWEADRATDVAPIVEQVEQIVRAWPAVEAVVPSFDQRLELVDDLADDSVTLSRAAFRVLTLVDGTRTVRQVARELGRSVVVVGPMVKELIEQGALRLGTDEVRAEPDDASGLVLPPGAVHAVREPAADDPGPVVTSVPDPSAELDREALDRERAVLAARAGLGDPGPVPGDEVDPVPEEDPPETVTMTTDRGALLRLFSGLRDQG
jgi:hypothetical protein